MAADYVREGLAATITTLAALGLPALAAFVWFRGAPRLRTGSRFHEKITPGVRLNIVARSVRIVRRV